MKNYYPIFEVDEKLLSETEWLKTGVITVDTIMLFYEEMDSTKENDFFVKRGTTYSKKTKSVTEDDLEILVLKIKI